MKFNRKKKGFTLIELIVVMAVIGVLVLLAMPKFMGYTKEARLTELKNNIKQLENAAERYYMKEQDWPRGSETPFTAEELESFAEEIKSRTGAIIELEPTGKYYPIDYEKLQKYTQKPKDGVQYILQNPVGEVFYLDGLTEEGKRKLDISNPIKDPVVQPPITSITENMIFQLTNDNIVGNSWVDNVGGLHGYINNMDLSNSTTGDGLLFDGVDDYVDFGDNLDMGLNDMTIGIWVKTSTTTESVLISKSFGGVQNNRYSLDVMGTGEIRIFFKGNTSQNVLLHSVKKINDGAWHYVTAQFDRDGMATIFIDGIKDVETDISVWKNVDIQSANPFRVGSYTGTGNIANAFYEGELADLRIYDRVLTGDEIVRNITAGKNK